MKPRQIRVCAAEMAQVDHEVIGLDIKLLQERIGLRLIFLVAVNQNDNLARTPEADLLLQGLQPLHEAAAQAATLAVASVGALFSSPITTLDDYGDENWDRWLREKIEEAFREYHRRLKARPASSFNVDNMSGAEFETWVGRLLTEKGFDVSGNPATGDQGTDLIARKNGLTIVIQAKRRQGAVGNRAVQEAISALAYYGGDKGWVITNSSFTPSAKALAQRSHIKLIDGKLLKEGALG
jgi:restriction endonuclease Mrr